MQQRLLGLPRMLAVFVLGVGLAQGSIYSQYTLDGPAVEDTYGRTDSEKQISLGSGDDAVCGKSYHARSRDFISLQASVGAPTGNADFSVAGYVKPVALQGTRALFAIGDTKRERRANGQWGAWVWVSRSGRLGMRTTTTATRSRAMLRPGVWAHVVLTYAAAETELRLWVDGKVVLTRRVAMDLRQNSSTGGMFIGAAHRGRTRGEFFIDHVSFANHTVTDVQEVAAPCLGGPSPTRAPRPPTAAPTRAPTPVPRTRAPTTPVPRTRAPTPVPTRTPPTPPPTRAPTPVPRTRAPTPVPRMRAPTPAPTRTPPTPPPTRAPATPVPTRVPPPATPAPTPTPDNAAVCAQKGSVCGPVRDGAGNTVDCGDCDDGKTCSFGRCEATCTLPQYANKRGPFDSLFAYVPLQFTYEDLSEYEHPVEVQLLANDRRADTFPYESAVDMTEKVVEVDFGSETVAPVATLSFKLMPQALGQSGVVLTFGPLTVSEADGKLSVTVGGVTVVSSAAESFSHRRCNHVAVQLSGDSVATFVNGFRTERAFGRTALQSLGGSLVVGRYPGKVWDVRVYERALVEAEIAGLGDDCGSALSMALPDAGYPNYLCGVYECIYWPAGVTDTTQESFDYQLSGHDMTWEHNVLETGMYVHGALCAEIAKPRDLLLTEGYRKSWVSKFNFEKKPWNQYVLHENFHAYQKRAEGSTKFLAESTASWGAFSQKPTAYDTILGMYTLQPQLALWTTQSSVFEDGIIDIGKGGHQYGAAIWWWYVTHHVLGDDFFIGKVYNRRVLGLAPTSGAPAEGMYNALREAGFDMRDVFSDFAARLTTWDMDYEDTFRASEAGSFRRLNGNNKNAENPLPDSEVDNKIAEFYSVEGAGTEWVSVPDRYRIGDWAFNAYEVDVTAPTTYQVGIKPSTENPAYSEFRAQAVVHNTETGKRTYHKVPVTQAGVAVTVAVRAAAGEKLYLVVANTPSAKFNGFEAYTYEYLLTPQTEVPQTPAPTAAPTRAPTPVPRTRAPTTPEPATPVLRTRAPTPVPTRAPASPPPAPTQPVDGRARVFLLAGQSNMVGHGKAAGVKLFDPTLLETRDDVFAKSIIEVRRSTGPLAPKYGKAVGPELGFGHVLGDTFADDVYLFKAAKGGTQIANPEHWAPEGDAGNLYKQAIAGFKQFLADDVPADHVVSGFVWFQGYNDAFSDANANGYEAALVKLIASVRRDLGVADLPVVVVQGNDNQGVRGNIIRAAQAKVATEDAHADWVASDDLYHYYHYDGPSMATIGRRAGQAMLPLLGRAGAFKDVYVGTQGETLQVAGDAGVLANDRGASAGEARVVSTASHGELSLRSDGGFTYRPAAGFVGLDTFTYAVADTATGAVGNPAVVEVWVETKAGSDEKLIMHYSFEEAGVPADSSSLSPSIVYDSTKRVQAHADPTGVSVGEADGVSGKCAVLSGTQRKWNDGHLKVQMSPMPDFLLFGLDDITVCMWVKVATPTTDKMTIFSNAGRPTNVGLTLLTDGPGKSFTTVVYGVDGRKVTVASGGPAIDDGEWHHVAAVVSRSTNTATNYVDGQAVSTASISAVEGVFEQGYYTRFGGVAWLASHPKFVGHMDEARVYRTALPAARIAQLFAGRM